MRMGVKLSPENDLVTAKPAPKRIWFGHTFRRRRAECRIGDGDLTTAPPNATKCFRATQQPSVSKMVRPAHEARLPSDQRAVPFNGGIPAASVQTTGSKDRKDP